MLVGSMVHAMIEVELTEGQDFLPGKDEPPIAFTFEGTDFEPPEDAAKEAHRVYWGWVKVRQDWNEGTTLGAELQLEAKVGEHTIQALIDHLVEDEDGTLTIEDFKTSSRSEDVYSTGRTRLQMHHYVIAAWANGYDVQRVRIRQIVKTKAVKENVYENIDLPTPQREAWFQRYLDGAAAREAQGPLGPHGAGCDWCYFRKTMRCKL